MNRPFKIGERIKERDSVYFSSREVTVHNNRPCAVVTDHTERGFKYRYEQPYNLGPRFGVVLEGECYEAGFGIWEAAPVAMEDEDGCPND